MLRIRLGVRVLICMLWGLSLEVSECVKVSMVFLVVE